MKDKKLRPLVAKHLETFKGYLATHGAEMVAGCLQSKTGHYKKMHITFHLGPKDKYQLLVELGLVKKKDTEEIQAVDPETGYTIEEFHETDRQLYEAIKETAVKQEDNNVSAI